MNLKKYFPVVMLALFIVLSIVAMPNSSSAKDIKKITVGYFPSWPGTYEYAWAKGWFEKELGVPVEFLEFNTGSGIITAMASGDVQFCQSLGTTPFVIGKTQGLPVTMIGVSDAVIGSTNLVVQGDSDIKRPLDLKGKKIAVPFGSSAHFMLMMILDNFGIEENEVTLLDLGNQDILPAFIRGDIDAGCGWEPAYGGMLNEGGRILVTYETLVLWGLREIGVLGVHDKFAKNHPDLVVKYLQVVDKATNFFHKNPEATYEDIGKKAGITAEKTKQMMKGFEFYTKEDQLKPLNLGTKEKPGMAVDILANQAKFLKKRGELDKILDDYSNFIDTSFYEKVK